MRKIKIVKVGFEYDESIDGKFSDRTSATTKVAVSNLADAQNKAMKKLFGNGKDILEWADNNGKIKKHRVNYSKIELWHLEVLEEED